MAASALFAARTKRSTWLAVWWRANSTNCASFSAVAMRVSARTLDQESRPFSISAEVSGRSARRRAARSRSRAPPREIPARQFSQWAQERHPLQRSSSS